MSNLLLLLLGMWFWCKVILIMVWNGVETFCCQKNSLFACEKQSFVVFQWIRGFVIMDCIWLPSAIVTFSQQSDHILCTGEIAQRIWTLEANYLIVNCMHSRSWWAKVSAKRHSTRFNSHHHHMEIVVKEMQNSHGRSLGVSRKCLGCYQILDTYFDRQYI